MDNQNYTVSILVDQTPEEVFNAINNINGWWSENTLGKIDELGSVFYYEFRDVHRATFHVTEFEPGKKVVWHVLQNYFNFVKDTTEWTGTDIMFEISKNGEKTELKFTHVGLNSKEECYEVCSDAWGTYIKHSLFDLITTGKGDPTLKGKVDRSLEQTSLDLHPNLKELK